MLIFVPIIFYRLSFSFVLIKFYYESNTSFIERLWKLALSFLSCEIVWGVLILVFFSVHPSSTGLSFVGRFFFPFYDSCNFIVHYCHWICTVSNPFSSILEGHTYLKICPFLLDVPICGIQFFKIACNDSLDFNDIFASNFIYWDCNLLLWLGCGKKQLLGWVFCRCLLSQFHL